MKIDRELTGALDQAPVPEVEPSVQKRKTKAKKQKRNSVIVGGVRYSLLQDPRSKVWRVRKRTKDINVDVSLGVVQLKDAEEAARKLLGKDQEKRTRLRSGGATFTEIANAYKKMPKRCSADVADANVDRWEKIVEVAWGKSMDDLRSSQLTGRLWEDYAAVRQGGKLDLSTRRHENRGINAAIRMAVSIFHKGLEEGYRRAGVMLDFEAIRRVQWLPIIPSKLPVLVQEARTSLMEALPALKTSNLPMWRAVMIARFAGLRSNEISAARKSWLAQNAAGAWCFEVRDRPEENWWHKTGEDYRAPILSAELVEDLLALPDGDGHLVPVKGSRDHFFKRQCNNWLRQFIPRPNKGMHRLRALYAEALKDATANAVLAQQAGIEAAQKALGHTTSTTTKNSYLPS